jgi:type IV secretion system protein VirB10
MTDQPSIHEQDERLKIRAAPPSITRINRKTLMLGGGIVMLAIFAAVSTGLKPQSNAGPTGPELYNVQHTNPAEGLAALPASYSDITKQGSTAFIPLGDPLPGDFGAGVLATERSFGIQPTFSQRFESDFRPDPEIERQRARQLKTAALAEEAARAPVFFKLESQSANAVPNNQGLNLTSELLALGAAPSSQTPTIDQAGGRSLQSSTSAFASEPSQSDIYNPHRIEAPASPFQVMAGTLIPASLITGINSDLPGTIIAQVTQPVYDTVTGRNVLIPQGSRLIGRYESEISLGQDRALVTWDRIIFPDGGSIQITAPGADAMGQSGLQDRTNHHWRRTFVAAGLATVLGIGTEIGASSEDDIVRAIRRGTGDTITETGQQIVERNLGIPPTITIRPGWPVRVIVTRDLILEPLQTGPSP